MLVLKGNQEDNYHLGGSKHGCWFDTFLEPFLRLLVV